MNIHHLNCGSLQPYFPQVAGVVYCLLVESDDGLVLVDTGFGLEDYRSPSPIMRIFLAWMRVPRHPRETAIRQVEELGFSRQEVRHVVITHLHLDHAGGLPDFPHTQVHLYRPEYEAAMQSRGLLGLGYLSEHWAHNPQWVQHELSGDQWFGFDCIPILPGVQPEILLVPLVGHTQGHSGVAIQTSDGWLLHCGDAASPYHKAVDLHRRSGSFQALNFLPDRWAQRFMGPHAQRLRSLRREHSDQVTMISSHDYYAYRENTTAGQS